MNEPIEVWTDKNADDLRANIIVELKQKGIFNRELEEAVRHIMIFIRLWDQQKHHSRGRGE